MSGAAPAPGTPPPGANPAARLTIASFSAAPKKPLAGKRLVVRLAVSRSDTRARVTTGRVTCSAQIAGKRVQLERAGFRSGAAECSWSIPKSARGKLVTGQVKVAQGALSASRGFRLRVR